MLLPAFKTLLIILIFQSMTLFNFSGTSNITNWQVIDDVVMGGRSDGHFQINDAGHGEYTGNVSLENNGGFSSLRYDFESIATKSYSKFILKIKGDGKSYQFRVKDSKAHRYSFNFQFITTGDWETIEIPFSDMHAAFRGRRVDVPNFEGLYMEQIAFLIGNKKAESFKFLIDSISIE